MNCFCGIVDRRKMFSLIFSRDHCQRSSPSWIFNTPWTEFESAQNTSSGLVEWNCAVVITTTPRRHKQTIFYDILGKQTIFNGRGKLTTLDTMVLFQIPTCRYQTLPGPIWAKFNQFSTVLWADPRNSLTTSNTLQNSNSPIFIY